MTIPLDFCRGDDWLNGLIRLGCKKRTENLAAHPVPLKTYEETMIQWIPVAIAVLQVIKESMEE